MLDVSDVCLANNDIPLAVSLRHGVTALNVEPDFDF